MTGYKVEELTPQPSAYSTTSRHAPRRTLLQKEGNSNVSYRGIERKPLKYLKVCNKNILLKYCKVCSKMHISSVSTL